MKASVRYVHSYRDLGRSAWKHYDTFTNKREGVRSVRRAEREYPRNLQRLEMFVTLQYTTRHIINTDPVPKAKHGKRKTRSAPRRTRKKSRSRS